MSVIGTLASFVVTASAAALPPTDQCILRAHMTDTVMAGLAGPRVPEGRALRAFGSDIALADRIARHSAATRLTELDDIHLASCTTPSSVAVPVALLLAQHLREDDPDRIASAIWVGTELMTRIGEALRGPEILYRGIWPSYFAAPVAAAATAARMTGLDQQHTAQALSLGLMLAAGGIGRFPGAPTGRWFLFASAVSAGINAAAAAGGGYCGDDGLLDGDWIETTHGLPCDMSRLTEGIGTRSVYQDLSQKPFCSAKQSIAAVEAFQTIAAGENLDLDRIKKITVSVPAAYAQMVAQQARNNARSSLMVSASYQIALAAVDPDRLYEIDRWQVANNPMIQKLISKITVVPEPALNEFYPRHWPAEVEITMPGKTWRHRVLAAHGDPGRRLYRDAFDQKVHRVLNPMIGAPKVKEWLAICGAGLEDAASSRRLVDAVAQAADEEN